MDEMDMDDKTTWMTYLETSKAVSTVCVTMVKEMSIVYVNTGEWNKEQRSSGSGDVVWMKNMVKQMKSGSIESEMNERYNICNNWRIEKLYLRGCL